MTARPLSRLLGILWLCWSLVGCAMAPESRAAAIDAETAASAEPWGEDNRGIVAGNPTRGAFFEDGSSGDVRARAENLFETPPTGDPRRNRERADGGAAERMMVRTAELQIEVPRTENAVARCEELVAEHGGYVSRRDGGTLTCRVPAARFDLFVDAVKAMGPVLHEAMQALDVTDQHRDLAIRLDNAKKSRERLLALLEQAAEVEDLLKIENELRRLTEEIERMTAELQNLEGRVALSTVTVAFQAVAEPDRPSKVRRRPSRFPWINAIGAENVLRSF